MSEYKMNLSVNKFKHICRTCLGERGPMFPLSEKCFGTCLVEMLLSVTFVQFSDNDKLPLQICSKCKRCVIRAYCFAQQCVLTDTKLQTCLKKSQAKKCRKYSNVSQTQSELNTKIIVDDQLELQTEIKVEENSEEEIEFENVIMKVEPQNCDENMVKLSENTEIDTKEENCDFEPENLVEQEIVVNSERLSQNKTPDNEINIVTNMEDDITCENNDLEQEKLFEFDDKVDLPYRCKKCFRRFPTFHHIREHWKKTKHLKNETFKKVKSFRCEFCGKLFNIKSSLLCHIKIHTGDKPNK